MKIKILKFDENPLTLIGGVSGLCYGATNPKRFRAIAERCLKEGHGRVLEFTDITMEISGVSAKVIRELYTHCVGTSKLQASTRYIDYTKCFDFIIPQTVKSNADASKVWFEQMCQIKQSMLKLKELGIPTEDYTNLLPLAYETKCVVKINLRSLIHMFNVRSCTCAYIEFREIMKDIKKELSSISDEWKFIADNYLVPKCIAMGYCEETSRSCGIMPIKESIKTKV